MFSTPPERKRPALGLRLAIWYAAIFVASSLTLIALTYLLLSTSLRQYDREIIETTLVRYATAYRTSGVNGLAAAIRRDQTGATYEPLFVRAVGPFQDVMYLSPQTEGRGYDLAQLEVPAPGEQTWGMLGGSGEGEPLEVASVRLLDGTLFQVGKSTARRELLLRRFRIILLVDFASLVVIGLAGGAAFTASALRPLVSLNETVREILRTGKVQSRVPARESGDALDELGIQVNAMLDRIESLIAGMRGALDNVAHDLRTPMMRLRGIAETALQSRDDAAGLREALADCLEESDRVVAMLNTLMDISEAETGTMRLHRERVNLTELVEQAVELYEDAAEDKGVTLENQVSGDLWIDVDRTRMRQVIANLLDNAVKYTPAGGKVEIRTEGSAGDVLLSVRDTGIGISADELPRIWERLYRSDKSRSERGLGLGLSLVKAIVQAHRGRVTVESEPDRGSRFVLHLQAATPLREGS
jgi:signal transduction histidine kinase